MPFSFLMLLGGQQGNCALFLPERPGFRRKKKNIGALVIAFGAYTSVFFPRMMHLKTEMVYLKTKPDYLKTKLVYRVRRGENGRVAVTFSQECIFLGPAGSFGNFFWLGFGKIHHDDSMMTEDRKFSASYFTRAIACCGPNSTIAKTFYC